MFDHLSPIKRIKIDNTNRSFSPGPDGDRLVSKSESALLLSFIGITNTVGRLLFGVIADLIKKGTFRNIPILNRMTVMTLNNYSLFMAGVCIIFIPFSKNYFQIVFICLAFGVCIGGCLLTYC